MQLCIKIDYFMTPEDWEKVNKIYHSALELKTVEREKFLEETCADDEPLLREVKSLLAAHDEAGDFVAKHALVDSPTLLIGKDSKSLIGKTLNHYQIISQIGSGGMGEVYLAKDSNLNRSVAIKTLPDSFLTNEKSLKRFQTEAEAVATLNHPNIATIYSVEEADGQKFITMEYVEGKTFDKIIPSDGLDIETFLEWFISLSDALAHAHEKGIVHRDIKPVNIMITDSEKLKILDFGLARIDSRSQDEAKTNVRLTNPGQILGTPAYMSPEQAEGKEIDHRTDIFSLGVVMYEAITGNRPFKGDSYASIVSGVLKDNPPSISDVRPEIPFLISRVVMRCLSKNKNRRFQTMHEVRTILEEVKASIEADSLLSKPALKVFTLPKKFSRSFVFPLLALLFLLGGFTAWFLFTSNTQIEKQVGRFSINPSNSKSIRLFSTRLSPDGRYIVFVSKNKNNSQLVLRPIDKFEEQPITGTNNAKQPFFSPDGKWIAFFQNDNTLKKIPFEGGKPLTICEKCPLGTAADWGTNNTIIVADKEGLYRVSAEGGNPERLTKFDKNKGEQSHRVPHFLPDEKNVLFTIDQDKTSYSAVLSLETKEWKILENADQSFDIRYLPTGHIVFSRNNRLFAAPFDLEKLEIKETPIPVLEGVFISPNFQIANNGTLLYLPDLKRDNNSLVWVNRNGKVSPVFEKPNNYQSPKLSPDGEQIAVQIDDDIWVFEVKSGKSIRLTSEGENQAPLWTFDGKFIFFASIKDDVWQIYKRAANGISKSEKVTSENDNYNPYSFHPTENILAMTSWTSIQNKDVRMLSENGETIDFLNSAFTEDVPRFSPDGNWVAFYSDESGRMEVYVQSWIDNKIKIPISNGGGFYPTWSANGKELFYRKGNKILSVEIAASRSEIKSGSPKVLFEGNYLTAYDVSSDGEKFLMVKNEQGTLPKNLNVVLNWTEELKTAFDPKEH